MASKTQALLRRERMEITLHQLVELFVAAKKTEGRTAKTTDWYHWILGRFERFVGDQAKIADVTLDDGGRFVATLQAKDHRYEDHPISVVKEGGLSPYTISCYVRTLKVFSTWVFEEGFTKTDTFGRLKRPKLPEPMIEVLTDQEIADILKSIHANTFLGARTYAIFLLLLDTGIRADELITLTVEHTDVSQGTIKVLGKGRKERVVPFGAGTKKALLRYITTFRPRSDSDRLFLNPEGGEMTYTGLAQMIRRLGSKAGVDRLHPHLLRHTFAVRYLMNGGDVMTLRLILGHTTLQVTQMYMHLAESHVKVQHNRFSPVDRLGFTGGSANKRGGKLDFIHSWPGQVA